MNFYSVRDLRTESKNMWSDLNSGDEVVLTNNGKPSAIVIDIPDGYFDETVQAVRQAKAMIAVNSMRQRAAREGYMSDDEINDLIGEVRTAASGPSETGASERAVKTVPQKSESASKTVQSNSAPEQSVKN